MGACLLPGGGLYRSMTLAWMTPPCAGNLSRERATGIRMRLNATHRRDVELCLLECILLDLVRHCTWFFASNAHRPGPSPVAHAGCHMLLGTCILPALQCL